VVRIIILIIRALRDYFYLHLHVTRYTTVGRVPALYCSIHYKRVLYTAHCAVLRTVYCIILRITGTVPPYSQYHVPLYYVLRLVLYVLCISIILRVGL
jgi:hypothetical protein